MLIAYLDFSISQIARFSPMKSGPGVWLSFLSFRQRSSRIYEGILYLEGCISGIWICDTWVPTHGFLNFVFFCIFLFFCIIQKKYKNIQKKYKNAQIRSGFFDLQFFQIFRYEIWPPFDRDLRSGVMRPGLNLCLELDFLSIRQRSQRFLRGTLHFEGSVSST